MCPVRRSMDGGGSVRTSDEDEWLNEENTGRRNSFPVQSWLFYYAHRPPIVVRNGFLFHHFQIRSSSPTHYVRIRFLVHEPAVPFDDLLIDGGLVLLVTQNARRRFPYIGSSFRTTDPKCPLRRRHVPDLYRGTTYPGWLSIRPKISLTPKRYVRLTY